MLSVFVFQVKKFVIVFENLKNSFSILWVSQN
jgi:hypothetical protein